MEEKKQIENLFFCTITLQVKKKKNSLNSKQNHSTITQRGSNTTPSPDGPCAMSNPHVTYSLYVTHMMQAL